MARTVPISLLTPPTIQTMDSPTQSVPSSPGVPTSSPPSTPLSPSPISTQTPTATPTPPPQPLNRTHTMITRAMAKNAHLARTPQSLPREPSTLKQALADPLWLQAMCDEYDALMAITYTWKLIPASPNQNIIGGKWVFRIKRRVDGSIDRYKARLVAKGFQQCHAIDYHETYSLVTKLTTVRLVLTLAIQFGWTLRQLDVNNAFLHGKLADEVFMCQPPGFHDPNHPTCVCKLQKSLYSLKQAPRVWFHTLKSFLQQQQFRPSTSDNSLFIYSHHDIILLVLIYVDDIIVIGNDPPAIS